MDVVRLKWRRSFSWHQMYSDIFPLHPQSLTLSKSSLGKSVTQEMCGVDIVWVCSPENHTLPPTLKKKFTTRRWHSRPFLSTLTSQTPFFTGSNQMQIDIVKTLEDKVKGCLGIVAWDEVQRIRACVSLWSINFPLLILKLLCKWHPQRWPWIYSV